LRILPNISLAELHSGSRKIGGARLLTPVLETFNHSDSSTIVVIGSGRIFDLDDWADPSLAQCLLLVSLGESLQETPGSVEEMTHPTPQELQMRLDDPNHCARDRERSEDGDGQDQRNGG
jgi:hypothetical protein